MDAGIKVWIVTGDKNSTAKAIGYDCGILDKSREMVPLTDAHETTVDKTALLLKLKTVKGKDIMISGTAIGVLIDMIEIETNKEAR